MAYEEYLKKGNKRDCLIVAIHGFDGASDRLAGVRAAIDKMLPDADVFTPRLPLRRLESLWCTPERIIGDLIDAIDRFFEQRRAEGGEYRGITLLGHSLGAVIARKVLVVAFGEQRDKNHNTPAPFEPEFERFKTPRLWAGRIERLVLLAGMNRGWAVSSTTDWITAVKWSVGELIGEVLFFGKPIIFSIRKGAPFLVNTRLQWLALCDPEYGPHPQSITVQLLGTGDDVVSPDDNIDYAVDLFGVKERQYFYIEVRNSNHSNVVKMADDGPAASREHRAHRQDQLRFALTANAEKLRERAVTREQMADSLPPTPDPKVTDVVFVIHGIRDKGFWTQKVARTIKKIAPSPRRFASFTGSYGYFAILPFLIGPVRQRKVEWLMDRYVEARACYPRATFHYVGHSNGTYLAAQALRDYRAAKFGHIVFAGSVVRCDYDWLSLMSTGEPRVSRVLNYVATRDWVVALFPKAMQPLKFLNLGSAGHDGFNQASPDGPVHEVRFIAGSHGAGHHEAHWEDIARFVVFGTPPRQSFPPLAKLQSGPLRKIGRGSSILFPALLTGIFAIAVALVNSVFAASTGATAGLLAIATFLYLGAVYLFITRF